MKEAMKITIEEWSSEHNLVVNEEQAEDLIDALDICCEIESVPNFFQSRTKSEKDKEIEILKNKLRNLELFINSKGFSIDVGINDITEHVEERISVSHAASREIRHQF
jgi:hypothetical protein